MAIIYSYPAITDPQLTDLLLVTDISSSDPKNQTKTMTIQQVADLMSDQVTLQEVLDTGNTASGPNASITISGDLSANNGTFSGDLSAVNITASAIAQSQTLTVTGSGTVASKLDIGTITGIPSQSVVRVGGRFGVSGPIGDPNALAIGGAWNGGSTKGSSSYGGAYLILGQGGTSETSLIQKGTGQLTIGRLSGNNGNISIGDGNTTVLSLRSDSLDIDAANGIRIDNTTTGDIVIENSANPGQIIFTPFTGNEILLNGRTNAVSYIDFQADNGIRLNGVSGTAGQLIQSQGAGLPLVWTGPDDLEVLSAKKIIVNARTTTGPIAIGDPLYISDVEVGNRFTVSKADASDPLKMPVVGLAVEAVAGASGNFTMIVNGDLAIDTGTIPGTNPAALNDIIYVAPTGGLTTDRPTAVTDLVQNVGVVSDTGANGAIKVSAIGRTNDTPNIISNTRQFQVTDNRGSNNVTFGSGAFDNASTADDCVAIGFNAGQAITTATSSRNVAIGKFSMDGSAIGERNTAIGTGTLGNTNNVSAINNIAIGDLSLNSLTTAADNTFVGSNSGFNVTTGSINTGIGKSALSQVSTGESNVALGYNAGNTVTGDSNTLIGAEANAIAGTSRNVFIGRRALGSTGHGDGNIVIGADANTDGTRSIVIGSAIGLASTTPAESSKSIVIGNYIDSENGASGAGVGGSITIGTGESSQSLNNLAQNGIHIGVTAASNLGLTTNADGSIGIGSAVLIDSSNAIAIGSGSSVDNLSRDSIAIGTLANVAASSRDGIAIGQSTAVSGGSGIAVGLNAAAAQNGISVGESALTAGDGIAIGLNAGTAPSGSVGSSIMIGDTCGSGTTNGIAIGNTAEVGAHQEGVAIGTGAKTGASHDVALGGIDMTTIGAPTGVGTGGTLGIGVRQVGIPAPGAFQSQAPIAQIPVKFPDAAGNLVTGHIYIYP